MTVSVEGEKWRGGGEIPTESSRGTGTRSSSCARRDHSWQQQGVPKFELKTRQNPGPYMTRTRSYHVVSRESRGTTRDGSQAPCDGEIHAHRFLNIKTTFLAAVLKPSVNSDSTQPSCKFEATALEARAPGATQTQKPETRLARMTLHNRQLGRLRSPRVAGERKQSKRSRRSLWLDKPERLCIFETNGGSHTVQKV